MSSKITSLVVAHFPSSLEAAAWFSLEQVLCMYGGLHDELILTHCAWLHFQAALPPLPA